MTLTLSLRGRLAVPPACQAVGVAFVLRYESPLALFFAAARANLNAYGADQNGITGIRFRTIQLPRADLFISSCVGSSDQA